MGWYLDRETTEAFDFNTDTTENLTLYAKWDKVLIHTVTFETNGGAALNPTLKTRHGSTITEPLLPTKKGYAFDGWYKEATFETLWNFQQDIVNDDITLYAKWNKVVTYYSVNFESNGGTPVLSINNIEEGKNIVKPEDPTREGYTFIGWYKDTSLNSSWDFKNEPINSNLTLYAKWQENEKSVPSKSDTPKPEESQTGTLSGELPKTGNTHDVIAYMAILGSILTLALYSLKKKKKYK